MLRSLALVALFALTFTLPASAGSPATTLDAVLSSPDWLNGRLDAADVRGKVVLVDFYTFECINCQHVEPNLARLHAATSDKDFVIIGVHSPETLFERDRANLKASIASQGIKWPVVIDNSFDLWNAYGVSAWPTQLIFDRHGKLRQTIVGEGQDEAVDAAIRALVANR